MTRLTGRVVVPGDLDWDSARQGFNARYDYDGYQPAAVVFCRNSQDVIHAVRYARERRLPLRVRCGRHNYQGYSSRVRDGMIVDIAGLKTALVDSEAGTAVVGSGLNMLELTQILWDAGVTIPLATGSTVGISGLTLGGGFGVISRKFGLTCDNLLRVEIVNAGGELIHASARENADLFWALRGGGGGNFGVATSFTFRTHPISLVGVFKATWNEEQFERAVDHWQRWAYDVEDSIISLLTLRVDGSITMTGQYTTEPEELSRLPQILAPLLRQTSPASVSVETMPHLAAARQFFELDPACSHQAVRLHGARQCFKSTSAIAPDYFSTEAIRLLRAHLKAVPALSAPASQLSMAQLLGGGGAMSRIAPDATAVVHRSARFVVQYDGYWSAAQDEAPTARWVTEFRRAMLPHARDAYVNYADEELEDPLRDYFGSNLDRLVQVKQKYDPENIFHFPQSVPLTIPDPPGIARRA